MRQGKNPYKNEIAYHPKKVTIAVLVFIPVMEGYHKDRFEIFKVCLSSILHHTHTEFDLLVFDNGSCSEVQAYLQDLRAKNVIQYLVQMSENVGILNAYNMIFSMAPGEYIAYSDDDMFFYPGWLETELAIAEEFTPIGMVSGLPTWQNFGFATDSVFKLIEASGNIEVEQTKGWPADWTEKYCRSIGRPVEEFIDQCADKDVVKLSRNNVSAFVTGTHCQFLVKKENLATILPINTTDNTAMKNVARFDEKLDRAGFLRLSTDTPLVWHMGNVLEEKDWQEISEYNINGGEVHAVSKQEIEHDTFVDRLVNTSLGRRVVLKFYGILFELSKRIKKRNFTA